MPKSTVLRPVSVLLLSPYPHIQGGVAAFAEALKGYLKGCDIQSLHIGNRGKTNDSILLKLIRLPALLLKLAFLLWKSRFDVIHINPSLNTKSLIRDGLILFCLQSMKFRNILVYFHGWEKEMEQRIRNSAWIARIFTASLNNVAHIMVLAPEFREALTAIGVKRDKITCTSTLFDEKLFRPIGFPAPVTRDILFLSRFDARKGIYELLAAFGQIAAEFPDTRLVLAGDGEEALHLRVCAAALGLGDRIIFPGYVSDTEKAKWLLGCAIFALPTYFPEGMPVALLEAMAAGKPLLTAKAGGIAHIVHEPEHGIVLPKVTEDTVAQALRRMLGDKRYCHEAGERNRAYAWKYFSATVVAGKMEGIYREFSGK